MFLRRIIQDSSMKQQWSISDSEFNTMKTIKIRKVAIEIINVSNMSHMSLQRIIDGHRRSSKETSRFRRLGQKNPRRSLKIASKSSLYCQSLFKETQTNRQGTSNEKSMIHTLTQQKNEKDKKRFLLIYQCFDDVSPKHHQRIIKEAVMKHQCFGD